MNTATAPRMGEPDEAHCDAQPAPHHPVDYFRIFLLLVVLTIVTVALATHRFESEMVNVLLALTVATTKASFVALYFMHLKFEGKLIYLILGVPVFLSIVLTCALIPDFAFGRLEAFNDVIGIFEKAFLGG